MAPNKPLENRRLGRTGIGPRRTRRGRTCSRGGSPRPVSVLGLSQTKLRPGVVLAAVGRGDCILCQITSKPYGDTRSIRLDNPPCFDWLSMSGPPAVISTCPLD